MKRYAIAGTIEVPDGADIYEIVAAMAVGAEETANCVVDLDQVDLLDEDEDEDDE
jgi:hypothetical protein